MKRSLAYGFIIALSLDTNWDPEEKWSSGVHELFPYIDIFLPNENEAMAISGSDNINDAAEKLSESIPLVVIKKGAAGSTAIKNKKIFHAAGFPVTVKDTVGAGDNFDAGFIYGFLYNLDVESCLKIGNFCGSMSTTVAGGIKEQPDDSSINRIILPGLETKHISRKKIVES